MDVVTAIERMGGMASRASLIQATSRADVDRALRAEAVVRAGHGRYTLPSVDAAAATAFRMNGHLSLTSAALHHGWEVKDVPKKPHVVFPKHRNVPRSWRNDVVLQGARRRTGEGTSHRRPGGRPGGEPVRVGDTGHLPPGPRARGHTPARDLE